ncbi:hypothetical protein EVAR_45416_1 [Eumeta japonica]|uniref:Uncharacterized protein n=1 Tax=Eumeta variegata TaxID=151549 RepID=A0A4C1ZE42_EUMVA|nr:hypothetical protein EVAR_45416_1 [Eumeta japonica]
MSILTGEAPSVDEQKNQIPFIIIAAISLRHYSPVRIVNMLDQQNNSVNLNLFSRYRHYIKCSAKCEALVISDRSLAIGAAGRFLDQWRVGAGRFAATQRRRSRVPTLALIRRPK